MKAAPRDRVLSVPSVGGRRTAISCDRTAQGQPLTRSDAGNVHISHVVWLHLTRVKTLPLHTRIVHYISLMCQHSARGHLPLLTVHCAGQQDSLHTASDVDLHSPDLVCVPPPATNAARVRWSMQQGFSRSC
jgi:hypothetical protein